MIALLIRWSIANRFLVLMATLFIAAAGIWAINTTPVDALPDLSDVQVIVRTSYPGQAPQIVENQVTYPMTTTMLSVPGAQTVRGYSFFGDSFVYVIFKEGTDLYWARSRVLEYLSQVQSRLPAGAKPALGPDASGVGWVYEYALVDKSGKHDLSQLRGIQDWFLRFELKSLPNVAEVASIGGMVKQYQIVLDPVKMAAYRIAQQTLVNAVQQANQEAGGSVLELAETDYIVRASGYLKTLDDFRKIPLSVENGIPITLGDVATVQVGPELRQGVADLNGQGESVGGVIVLRSGENARATIASVKQKLHELQRSLPDGVEVVPVYDRSKLIDRSIDNLTHKLIEEFVVVTLVCALFLWHFRSALVAIISLPLGIMLAFLLMRIQGINANMMSLAGIAIAIGAMVDAAIVMIENAHKKIEHWRAEHPGEKLEGQAHWQVISDAATEVGPALFFSLLVITLSFIPVFTLESQEGKLFGPLAFTKTYAMAGAALLSITLVPVLMGFWIRGRIPDETRNPINRGLTRVYRPMLDWVLRWPKLTLLLAALTLFTVVWPLDKIGSEFLPAIDEGDLLYMPSALPGLSVSKASQLLQQTDRLIKTVPEVQSVFGKAGRAESATDPAPVEMFETTIQFKPRDQWRKGMTPDKLVQELDRVVKVPGLANIWVPPIRNRIDMLATGIKSPIGVRILGPSLEAIDHTAQAIEKLAKSVPGVNSALAERLNGGHYIDVNINRAEASRYGLNIADVQAIVSSAIGGANIGETVEGLARYPINLRYPREIRDSLNGLRELPIYTPSGQQITLGTVAALGISSGPTMVKTENARLSGLVYIDANSRDVTSVVEKLRHAVDQQLHLPPGVSVEYAGQFEYLQHAVHRLKLVVPATLAIIFLLLYLIFRRVEEALLLMFTLPFAMVGGIWLLYLLGYNLSIASGIGFIALAGVSAEFGVIMLVYLRQAMQAHNPNNLPISAREMDEVIREGATLRVRPKAMTVAVILAGLLPILWSGGTGSEVMSRIAAPMVGGMITAPLLSMFIIPALWRLLAARRFARTTPTENTSIIQHKEGRK
ncbi:efflux RND transporter permease subunit [Ewingella sp. AOP9-I1-14]